MDRSLLRNLFDETEEPRPLTVSQLNAQVKGTLEGRFASVLVEGEIANFSAPRSGHWYFTLHDASSQLRAACYRGANMRIRFQPFDGLQVRVRGKLTVYEPKGDYQMLVESLQPVGEGALRVAFEQIRTRLEAEGLFAAELKRRLPRYPRRIGVVTSPTGAAYFDILNVLTRRARSVSVVLVPTRVQGESAAAEICEAIRFANVYNAGLGAADKIDVLIVGRGGGSAEDLWVFNEETVARAIRASAIPVISAVGHEIDHTIADLVADLRAPTPSAAAEIVAQREEDICRWIDQRATDLEQILRFRMLQADSRLQSLELSPAITGFPRRVKDGALELEDMGDRLAGRIDEIISGLAERLAAVSGCISAASLAARTERGRSRFEMLFQRASSAGENITRRRLAALELQMAKLDTLSPLSVLNRGYSLTQTADGSIVRDPKAVQPGDKLKIRLAGGKLDAEVLAS